ncbi:nf-x1 finger and helicase domain [Seiridium cupressi]
MSTAYRDNRNPRRVCHHFLRNRCNFGAECKFSHDRLAVGSPQFPRNNISGSTSSRQQGSSQHTSTSSGNVDEAREDRLREWKRLLHLPNTASFQPREKCNRFFSTSLELMRGDAGASQETIRYMAKEDGLAFIRALAEHHIPGAAVNILKVEIWLGQMKPLFQILIHPRVIDSAGLEQEVATIYNYLQGIGGRRMKIVFDFATGLLTNWQSLPLGDVDESPLTAAELCLAVLSQMIDCTVTNIVNEHFQEIAQRFDAFIAASGDSSNEFPKPQARKYLQYIQRRLGIGEQLPTTNLGQRSSTDRAEFVMRRDLPGQLSADGPRHDNDHADISKISILPTQEEISSPRAEYLPTNDISHFHIPGIRGRLDREFRLLREDTVGQLRDAVRAQLEYLQDSSHSQTRTGKNDLRTYTYQQATVQEINVDKNHGLGLLVKFRQPLAGQGRQKLQDWWTQTKRLQPGGLVCAISERSVLFCVIGAATVVSPDLDRNPRGKEAGNELVDRKEKPSLAGHADFAYVQLHIAETADSNIVQALRWYREINRRQQRTLVEFPGVLLPAFQHTLQALQRMSQKPDLPFTELVAHEHTTTTGLAEVPPPLYAASPGFVFDLSCLTNDNSSLKTSVQEPLSPQVLAEHTLLDETQSRALIDTLTRSLALTQGPPGTGKSFTGEKVIKVLLDNKRRANIGPILCVCYTNHALDQLLEHLHKDGVRQIIRMGSRSKSDVLETLNLRVVASTAERTKTEKSSLWQTEKELERCVGEMTADVRKLQVSQSERAIQDYLLIHAPAQHNSLFGEDEDGFTQVQRRPEQIVDQWRRGGTTNGSEPRPIDVLNETPLWATSRAERARLYTHWLRSIRDPIVSRIVHGYKTYLRAKDRRDIVRQDVDLRCLSQSDIVGVTTTGLAKNLNLLRRVRSKVMLCEEAGEVLEAHTLTALLPSVEHAILIGDHQQLRPQIQNYELQSTNPRGALYSLDVSLFERLVNPAGENHARLPYNTLETQRRMHPQISELIRSTLYPSLEDGEPVMGYPMVVGMKKRLFWLHHSFPEDKALQLDPSTTSHTNSFELGMTVALVQHLVRQGSYGPDDIAVITPYLGQLHKLRHLMERMFEISVGDRDLEELDALEANKMGEDSAHGQPAKTPAKTTLLKSIRLATVDNFQGEEAKVVVISLVRSNEQSKCGFLSTPNRINVLLSRAQHGMYLIGNSKTYAHVPMWAKVLTIMEENQSLGTQLELQCPRHPNAPMMVSEPDHFLQFAPEGGCMLPCDRRLSCGHSCINRCHSEILHNAVKCLEPCPRPKKGCDHPCRLHCSDQCEAKCREVLEDIDLTLPCGHNLHNAYCWQAQDPSLIPRTTSAMLFAAIRNSVAMLVEVSVISARKRSTARLRKSTTVSAVSPAAETIRPADMLVPRHAMAKRSAHHALPRARFTAVIPNVASSAMSPVHLVPNKSAPRNAPTRIARCHAPRLATGCPVPRVCCSTDVKETMVDFIMALQYADIDLDEEPCIFPDCGHMVTKSSMDGIMDMKAHYLMSDNDEPIAVACNSEPFSMDEVKVCPTCRGSLRNVARYGRIVRRAMLDEATKKFISWSHEEYLKLARCLMDLQKELEKTPFHPGNQQERRPAKLVVAKNERLKQLHLVRSGVGSGRYKALLKLWHHISEFVSMVKKEEQPFQRVADFVQHAARQKRANGGTFNFDEGVIQSKGHLQGLALWLKCEAIIFADFMKIPKEPRHKLLESKLDLLKQMADCQELIKLASSANIPRQEVEGHLYFAQFCALTRVLIPESTPLVADDQDQQDVDTARERLKTDGLAHVEAARTLFESYPSTRVLEPEIQATETMLHDDAFYSPISADEMKAVYEAMTTEFRGTGHWYTCENGHPFTVGECGMPMQQARCPECNRPVGGRNHQAAAGVRHATEIERLARGVGDMNI